MNEHMNDKQFNLDKSLVRSSFNSAAKSYEEVAILQREIGQRLLQRLELINIQPQRVIDIGAGIGTQSKLLAQYYKNAKIIALDLSINMLQHGKDRTNTKHHYVCGDAECLPFPDNYFDCVIVGFGLRNVTRKDDALRSMVRVLKPGGRGLVLEFSRPVLPGLSRLYDAYSFNILPVLGKIVAKDEAKIGRAHV